MGIRVYASSGGGVRIGGTFGAAMAGEMLGKFRPGAFDWYAGTSAGALDAVLTANGWTGRQKAKLFANTDFSRFFAPFLVPYAARKALALVRPIPMDKLAAFFASLTKENDFGPRLLTLRRVIINTVDTLDNLQVVYCANVPEWIDTRRDSRGYLLSHNDRIRWVCELTPDTLPTMLARSMALPGLVADDKRFMDGGVNENPLLSVFPEDAEVVLMSLGYAGDTGIPGSLLDRALYAYEFKAKSMLEYVLRHYPGARVIRPEVYDVDPAAFNLRRDEREAMILKGFTNSRPQWAAM